MAKGPPKRVGPPTRVTSFQAAGRRNRQIQADVAIARGKRTAPLRKAKPVATTPGKGVDSVGTRLKGHLNSNTGAGWSATMARPRSYWERRFTISADEPVPYDEFMAAFDAMDSDKALDKEMSGRSMTIWAVVYDPEDQQEHVFTMAAFGEWQTSMVDMAAKLEEWANRYNRYGGTEISGVKRLVVFVGRK